MEKNLNEWQICSVSKFIIKYIIFTYQNKSFKHWCHIKWEPVMEVEKYKKYKVKKKKTMRVRTYLIETSIYINWYKRSHKIYKSYRKYHDLQNKENCAPTVKLSAFSSHPHPDLLLSLAHLVATISFILSTTWICWPVIFDSFFTSSLSFSMSMSWVNREIAAPLLSLARFSVPWTDMA